MKRELQLIAVPLVIVAILSGGCGGPAIKPLTDAEKEQMIAVALAEPEVSRWLVETDEYTVYERWEVIAWEDSKAVGWYRMDYEDIKDGSPPSDIVYATDEVTINPEIYIRVGEPARMFISVIFDSEREKILSVELQPGRPSAGPTPTENTE